MGPRRKLKEITGVLKDKASIIKATVITTKRTSSTIKVAILRATTHGSASSPPPEHRLEAILSLGSNVPPAACACIDSIMDRLHNTRNPHVALKCLLILHNILAHGSFILKEQLSYHPSNGGQNSLKLARFVDSSKISKNAENRELSQWVRWYASILECNLISSRTLGCSINSSSSSSSSSLDFFAGFRNKAKSNCSLAFGLLTQEIDSLVCMIEGICAAPESLHYQKMDLVHDLMLLVSEDYRGTQYHIIARLGEFSGSLDKLGVNDSSELTRCLKRLEGCRERLVEMFVNRKRNDAFWDLIGQTRRGLEELKDKRERGRMVVWKGGGGEGEVSELTRKGERVKGTSQVIKLLPYSSSQWLGVERV